MPYSLLFDLNAPQLAGVLLLFVWTGFVRSGLGFGGAALGLPLLLFIVDQPLVWLPIIGIHLLFFSALTLRTRLALVDWHFLARASVYVIPAALAGVFGLLNIPTGILLLVIYSLALFYGIVWFLRWDIHSRGRWTDRILLVLGGYVAGMSLTGAPLMVAIFMRNVSKEKLRNTLFVLWFVIVSVKMSTFVAVGVNLHALSALLLLPVAAIGHALGLKAHDVILEKDALFKRVVGGVLALVSLLGLLQTLRVHGWLAPG